MQHIASWVSASAVGSRDVVPMVTILRPFTREPESFIGYASVSALAG